MILLGIKNTSNIISQVDLERKELSRLVFNWIKLSWWFTEEGHDPGGSGDPPSTAVRSGQTTFNSWKLPDADELQQMTQYVTESMRLQTAISTQTLTHTQSFHFWLNFWLNWNLMNFNFLLWKLSWLVYYLIDKNVATIGNAKSGLTCDWNDVT